MEESNKDIFKQVFATHDQTGEGLISVEQLIEIEKELGIQTSTFKIYSSFPGSRGKKLNLEQALVIHQTLSGHVLKPFGQVNFFTKRALGYLSKVFGGIPHSDSLENHIIDINVSAGREAASTLGIELNFGATHGNCITKLLSGSTKNPQIFFALDIKTENSSSAKVSLQEIIDSALNFVKMMFPNPKITETLDLIKFEIIDTDPKSLRVLIFKEHAIIDEISHSIDSIISKFIQDEGTCSLNAEFGLGCSLKELIEDQSKTLLEQIKQGFAFHTKGEVSRSFIEKITHILMSKDLKRLQNENSEYMLMSLATQWAPLCVVGDLIFKLRFRDTSVLFDRMKASPVLNNLPPSMNDVIEMLKAAFGISDMLEAMPDIKSATDFFHNHCKSEFTLYLVSNKVSFGISGKVPGVKELYDKIK